MGRNYILFAAILLFVSDIAAGQQSLLWKVTPPDSKISSYIFCSSDLSGVELYDVATPVSAVMNTVNTVAFFNVPDETELQNIPVFMKSDGENTLKGFYKREDRIRFELMVSDKLKVTPENYYTTKPLYIMQLFREVDHQGGQGYQQTILLNTAMKTGKPTLSLLTMRQIGATMDDMDFQTQAGVLSNYVNNAETFIDADKRKFQAYIKQNTGEYASILYATEQPAFISTMLNNINELLIQKIEPLSTQQSVLYVLNTDLVCGDYGILKKLENNGYTVTAESISYKVYPGQKENNPATEIKNNTGTATYPDEFPEVKLMPSNSGYLNPEEIKVININDVKSASKKYIAYTDPFNDMFDLASADTLFLDYWYELKGTNANFTVMVPVKSDWEESETPWSDGGIIKKFIYQTNHAKSDLFYSVGYTVYPPTFVQNDKNNFFDQFITQTRDQLNGDIIAQRIISKPGYTGREFTAAVGDSFFVRSQFILQDNILFQLLVGGPGDNPFSAYAEAYLHSFELSSNTMVNWHLFEQSGFKCFLPTPPSKSSKQYTLPTGPMTVQTFVSDDYKDNVAYMVTVSAYPPGHKFGNTKSFFDDLIANAERQFIGKAYTIEKVTRNGIEGRYVEMQLMNKKMYRIYFFFDGGSVYQFVAGGDPSVMLSMNVNQFFDSIQFVLGR